MERRPHTHDALHRNLPAVRHDDLARDREPESAAAVRRRFLVVRLEELLEDVRQLLQRDAGARVAYIEMHLLIHRIHEQLHRSAALRELERVRDEIAEHFADAVGIPEDFGGQRTRALDPEIDPPLHRQHPERLLELGQEYLEVRWAEIELAAARLEAAHIQQLMHQARQGPRLRIERAHDLVHLGRHRPVDALIDQLQIAEDDVDRRFELVRCDGHELRFEPVERRQLVRHRPEALSEMAEFIFSSRVDAQSIAEVAVGHLRHAVLEIADGSANGAPEQNRYE